MKPRIGRTIYTVCNENITKTKVAFLGKDTFITDEFRDYLFGYEFSYDNYNVTWFTSLAKAKKSIMDCLDEDERKQLEWSEYECNDYWELIYKEE